MEVTFHNVTITIEAETPEAAYDSLCNALDAGETEWQTDTYSVGLDTVELTTEVLFPEAREILLKEKTVHEPVETFEGLVEAHGVYIDTDGGNEYCLTQNPYLEYVAGSSNGYVVQGETYYFAQGYDRKGNQVRLIWEITNPDTDDASEACDWEVFTVEPRGGDMAPWAEE